MPFPTTIVSRLLNGSRRFTVLQLNTLGRFDEPLDLVLKRQRTLSDYIIKLQPSIAALQEVPPSATALEGNANIVDTVKTCCSYYSDISYAKQTPRGDMGCLLYDTRQFILVHEEKFQFTGAGGTSQFAIIAILRLKDCADVGGNNNNGDTSGNCILVVAQHAKAGRNNECEAIRIDHSRQLLSYLTTASSNAATATTATAGSADDSVQALHHNRPNYSEMIHEGRLVWLGDFNAGPHSYSEAGNNWPCEWYRRVVKGEGVETDAPEEGTKSSAAGWCNSAVPLLSTMTLAHGGHEPAFTTYKLRDGKMISQAIDYIFVSKGSKTLVPVGVTSPPSAFAGDAAASASHKPPLPSEGFPNDDWGSDHLPLLCELEFRPIFDTM